MRTFTAIQICKISSPFESMLNNKYTNVLIEFHAPVGRDDGALL
jgi:hypothetical protein